MGRNWLPRAGIRHKGVHMESVIVACVTGVVTLVGVLASNSKSRIDKSVRVGV